MRIAVKRKPFRFLLSKPKQIQSAKQLMTSDEERRKLLHRLRRVGGQVDAVAARMIEEEAACGDIVMQISAATGALSKIALLLLIEHVRETLNDATASDAEQREAVLEDLINLFAKYAQTK
jgi:DNA-binding FrmR family transcriptional regulator